MKDGKNFMGGWDKVITEQFKVIKTKGQTNEEWLRSCSTEELAEWLCEEAWYGIDEVLWLMEREDIDTKKEAMIRWLKEKHTE